VEQSLFDQADYSRKMPSLTRVCDFWCREESDDFALVPGGRRVNGNWKFIKDLRADETWLDIGAHIGTFGAVIAPQVKHVIALEACPETFEVLKLNTASARNVECRWQAVVGAEQQTVRFHQSRGRTMGHVVPAGARSYIEVPAVSFNSLLTQEVCVKMDIEGGEKDILDHLTDWSRIRRFLLEFHSKALKDDDHEYCKQVLERFRANFRSVATTFDDSKKSWEWHIYGER